MTSVSPLVRIRRQTSRLTPSQHARCLSSPPAKAHTLLAQQDYELASRFLARILTQDPNNIETRELLGVCDLELGNVQEARNVRPPL